MNRKKYKYDFDCTINQSTQPQKVSIILKEDEIKSDTHIVKELVAQRIRDVLIEKNWVKKWDKIAYQNTWHSELKSPREVAKRQPIERKRLFTSMFWENRKQTVENVSNVLH